MQLFLPESCKSLEEFNDWFNRLPLQIINCDWGLNDRAKHGAHIEIHPRATYVIGDEKDQARAVSFVLESAAQQLRDHFARYGGATCWLRIAPEMDEIETIQTPLEWSPDGDKTDFYTDKKFFAEEYYGVVSFYMRFYASRALEQQLEGVGALP